MTGLQFVHDGATDEPATRDRELFQPARYGNRWAPVLVAWETEEQNPALAGEIVGEAGSVAVSLGDGPRVYLTGTVSLDAGTLPELLTRAGRTALVRSIVLHELGHLAGLGARRGRRPVALSQGAGGDHRLRRGRPDRPVPPRQRALRRRSLSGGRDRAQWRRVIRE